MINLETIFWLLIGLFAVVGALRGWTREVIATSGLILSLFAVTQFGYVLVSMFGAGFDVNAPPPNAEGMRRQQFYLLSIFHLIIAFFSYQGPAIAGRRISERLRVRDNLQDKVMGLIVGGINGYLMVGTLWAFLEFIVGPGGFVRVPMEWTYPFDAGVVVRPMADSTVQTLISRLPIPLLGPYLPFLVVLVFLFVIVVMI